MKFTMWDALDAASNLLDHDKDPDDSYAVEQFVRQHYSRPNKQFIATVQCEAIKLRDRNRLHGLFEYINKQVPAWPNERKISDDFKAEIADDVGHELRCLLQLGDDLVGSDMEKFARCVALLLIQQAAWRRYDDELKAYDYDKSAAEEGSM
jgi:hypothetical protein